MADESKEKPAEAPKRRRKANGKRVGRKTGRPSKFGPELARRICKLIADGDRPEVAAGVEGIAASTFYDWMARAERGEEPFAAFRSEVTRASHLAESEMRRRTLHGDKAGVGFGRSKAALEWLSRRRPKQWAQQVRHHIETLEDEFLSALEAVCMRPDVHDRVSAEKNCSFVLAAFCEEISRRESESGSAEDPGGSADRVH